MFLANHGYHGLAVGYVCMCVSGILW